MYDETPNKEEIDWIAARVREIYDYDRLKDCDIEYLYNQEFGVRAETKLFETLFPDERSLVQGSAMAAILDNENADREPLTEAERVRLRMLQREAEVEVHRAYGHRIELRRKHRNKLANAVSDAISALGSIVPW